MSSSPLGHSATATQPKVIVRHNNFRYFIWKISHIFSLLWVHSKIVYDLTHKLIGFLIRGSRVWMIMSIRLLCFVIFLMPGWIALLKYYIFDSLIIRNIEYGKGLRYRNVLDVYLPRPHNPLYGRKRTKYDNGVPVVVFVSGGAWIIGYKLWSALMGREFARRGYVVIVPDYRNFPQGNIVDMMEDLKEALRWTVCNSSMFGGDPKKIVLAGQSAGAHISLCTIIELYESYLKKQLKKSNSAFSGQSNPQVAPKSDVSTLHFPHVDTAAVLISSSLCLTSTPTSIADESGLDQTDIDQSIPSDHSNSYPSSPAYLPTIASDAEPVGDGVWWDVDTPSTMKKPVESVDYNHLPSPTSELDRNSLDILWDTATQNPEYMEPLSDGSKPKKPLSSPVDNLQEILTPLTPPCQYIPIPSPAALPLEINLLGSTEYASDVINDTARHNVDESIHDLDITDISLFIGISGPYNMVKLLQHLHFRGLDASILHHVFNSKVSQYSPVQRLNRLLHTTPTANESTSMWEDDENIIKQTYNQFYSYLFNVKSTPNTDESYMNLDNDRSLPPLTSLVNFPQVALFHGGRDQSIPSTVCDELMDVLRRGQVQVTSVIYPKMSHTDPILENVLAGETYLIDDMTKVIEEKFQISSSYDGNEEKIDPKNSHTHPQFSSALNPSASQHEAPVMVSRKLIYFARIMNPF